MFDLQLWDVSVGFITALVLVNLFPSISYLGRSVINGAVWLWRWAVNKISG